LKQLGFSDLLRTWLKPGVNGKRHTNLFVPNKSQR